MTSPLFRGTLCALAAAGAAFAPTVVAQQSPAVSDQAVQNETVHSDAQGRHLAAHDTFYTTEYVSARTDKGVEGFPPGTEVRLVSVNRETHTLTVTDGRANVELPPGKLTNDTDIADAVRAQDAATQERVARYQQAEAAAYQKYQTDVAEYTAKDLEKREQAIREANEQRAEQVASNHTTPTADATTALPSNNGYYNQGGLGYGSPYGYFIDAGALNTGNQNNARATINTANGSNGKGAISTTQNGNQSGNSRTGGATSGTSSSTGGGGTGGGKGPK